VSAQEPFDDLDVPALCRLREAAWVLSDGDESEEAMKIIDQGVDPIGVTLGILNPFHRFTTDIGVGGLARWTDTRIDILAIHSEHQNTGQCRWFFKDAKRMFKTVCVWSIHSEVLSEALARYGFTPQTEIDGKGEVLEGMRWDA
jgi:hypothetical protein